MTKPMALIMILVAGGSLVGCLSDDVPGTLAAPPPETVEQFKKRYTPEKIAADDTLLARFSAAHAAAQGLAPSWREQIVDDALAQDPDLAARLGQGQLSAWRALTSAGLGGDVSWDRQRTTPGYVLLGQTFHGVSGKQARMDLESRAGVTLEALFLLGPEDALVQVDENEHEVAMPHGDAPIAVYQARFAHTRDGRPVFGDWYLLTLTRSDVIPTAWRARVSARWTRSFASEQALLDSAEAITAASASGELLRGTAPTAPRLGYFAVDGVAQPAYEVWLREGMSQWRYYVSATTGDIFDKQSQSAENDGEIHAYVGRPYEAEKFRRPLPWADIYEDSAIYPAEPTCYYNPNGDQNRGDVMQLKGTTDQSGGYTGLMDYDPGDTSWVVDFRGPHVKDVSDYPVLAIGGIVADTIHTIANVTANARNRRGEMFYLLNHGWNVYHQQFLPQYEPLGFTFYATDGPDVTSWDCQSPTGPIDCCGGFTEAGCIVVECGMGPTGGALAERRFREVTFHEQNHSLRLKDAGAFCSGCAGTAVVDGSECNCWEEGRADFGAITVGQFEKFRGEYRPDMIYPADYDGNAYRSGAIWTSVYVDYMLRAGTAAIGDVNRNLAQVDTATRMVGACASLTDWTTCPVNSYYRQLLAAQEAWTAPRWRNTQEISAVFHDHVSDASRAVAGVQGFPWADETPNRLFSAPFIFTDQGGNANIEVDYGPEGPNRLALSSPEDFDTFIFKARAGETYTIGTYDLGRGVDTVLEVRTITATKTTLITQNDDCGGLQPESCVTFSAKETGYYRIIVYPHPGTVTGPSAHYGVYIHRSDDFGDSTANSASFAPDGVMHTAHGAMDSAVDVDVFQVSVPKSQVLKFIGCSTNGLFNIQVELRDKNGIFADSIVNADCGAPPTVTNIGPGNWYLHVSAPGGQLGNYGLLARLTSSDIDRDDTPGNAWLLGTDAIYGTMFENGNEEDWFRIDAQAGQTYIVEAINADAGVDPTLEIYAPSDTMYGASWLTDTSSHGLGHWMLSDDDGGLRPRDARVVFWAPVSGTYYVRARPAQGSSPGRYHIMSHNNAGYTDAYPAFP